MASYIKCGLGENVVLRLMECLTRLICLWITVSHLFVSLPILELATSEQQVCSTKIGYANVLLLGTNSCKIRNVANLRNLFGVEQSCKIYWILNNNQINSTVTTRAWFLSTEWIKTWSSTWLTFKWKIGGGFSLFVWIVDVAFQGAWVLYCIN